MGNVQGKQAGNTPIRALRATSKEVIAALLDKRGSVHNGRINDYRGVLEIIGCTSDELDEYASLPDGKSPTLKFIKDWPGIAEASGASSPTILNGWQILEQLGRGDVIEQCETVAEDVEIFHSRARRPTVPRSMSTPSRLKDDTEMDCITIHDVHSRRRTIYDGFVIYAPPDEPVVRRLVRKTEEHHLKLLIPDRDLLPGVPEYSVWAYAIDHRCRKLILVIGEEFMANQYCDFVVNYATALKQAARNRKIIIIRVSENSEIHPILNFYTYFRIDDDWNLLISAIKAPSYPEPARSFSDGSIYRPIVPVHPTPQIESSEERQSETRRVTSLESENYVNRLYNLSLHSPDEADTREESLEETYPSDCSSTLMNQTFDSSYLYIRTPFTDSASEQISKSTQETSRQSSDVANTNKQDLLTYTNREWLLTADAIDAVLVDGFGQTSEVDGAQIAVAGKVNETKITPEHDIHCAESDGTAEQTNSHYTKVMATPTSRDASKITQTVEGGVNNITATTEEIRHNRSELSSTENRGETFV